MQFDQDSIKISNMSKNESAVNKITFSVAEPVKVTNQIEGVDTCKNNWNLR